MNCCVKVNSCSKVEGWQVLQALQLQTQGQCGDQETYPNDKWEIAGCQIQPTKVQICFNWSLPGPVWPPGVWQMQMVWRASVSDVGAPLLPLQAVKRPAECALRSHEVGDKLDSDQMPTCAGRWAGFHWGVRSSDGGLPRGDWNQELPAKMIWRHVVCSRLRSRHRAQVWWAAVTGWYWSILNLAFVSGDIVYHGGRFAI